MILCFERGSLLEKQSKTFHYTYSAEQQKEIRQIREKYDPNAEDKLVRLRRLDRRATRRAKLFTALIFLGGIVLLVHGLLCILALDGVMVLHGILLGLSGLILSAAAFPLYKYLIRRQREKFAPQILQFSDELLKK